MRVTVTDESYTPSPSDMAWEFWKSNSARQAEILHSLAVIYRYNLPDFCNQMFVVGEQLNGLDPARADIVACLKEMIDQIER